MAKEGRLSRTVRGGSHCILFSDCRFDSAFNTFDHLRDRIRSVNRGAILGGYRSGSDALLWFYVGVLFVWPD